MEATLNSEQAKGLANFFFDLGKGVILGTLGFTVTLPNIAWEIRFANMLVGLIATFFCLKIAVLFLTGFSNGN